MFWVKSCLSESNVIKKGDKHTQRALFLIKWTLLAIDSDHLSTVKDLGITEFWVDDTGKHPYFWLVKNLLFSCPTKARKGEIEIPVQHNINNNKNTCEMRNCLQHSSESSTGVDLPRCWRRHPYWKGSTWHARVEYMADRGTPRRPLREHSDQTW